MDKTIICPKCSHVRPKDASNPEWQCPACGVCYAKADGSAAPAATARDAHLRERLRPAPEVQTVAGHSWNLGLVAKVALVVALGWGISVAVKHRQPVAEEEVEVAETGTGQQSDAGVALLNTALQVSAADAGMLKDLGGKLEGSCARNKYGLSESACIERVRQRGDLCANQTAARFPGQIGNADRMQEIVQVYVACIFEGAGR